VRFAKPILLRGSSARWPGSSAQAWSGNRRERQAFSLPGLDAWVVAEPCGADRGGDVYSIAASREGARVVLADVSGHGAQAAQCGARFARLLGELRGVDRPALLARDANLGFHRLATKGSSPPR
jgi:hypothetical protein